MRKIIFGILVCWAYLLFVTLSIPIYLYRLICFLYVKLFRPDIVDILNPLSSVLAVDLLSGKSPRANIVVRINVNNHLPFSTFRNEMVVQSWITAKDSSGKLIYGKFQQYPFQWMGFSWWKKEEFNIDNHVFCHENLGGSSPIVSDKELDHFTEKLLNAPFTPKRSPWEIHLIHNYQNKKLCPESELMSVIILKINHTLGDGYSILNAIVGGLFDTPVARIAKPRYPKRSLWERIRFMVLLPLNIINELSYAGSKWFDTCPWRVPDKNKAWHQLYGKSDFIPTQVVKDIKNATGVSFTSVILSAISAGINDNLKTKKSLGKLDKNVDSMFCLSVLPVPGHKGILTNSATAVMFDIPAAEFSSPLDRLRKCDTLLETTKESAFPRLTLVLIYGFGWHLVPMIKFFFENQNMVSTGLTNFPSIPVQMVKGNHIGVAGHFAVGCLPGNAGVAFMILSHGGYLRLAVVAEEAVLSRNELDNFVIRFTKEINTLYDIATTSKKLA